MIAMDFWIVYCFIKENVVTAFIILTTVIIELSYFIVVFLNCIAFYLHPHLIIPQSVMIQMVTYITG